MWSQGCCGAQQGMGTAAHHWAGTGMGTHVPFSGRVAQVGGAGHLPGVTLVAAGVEPGPGTAALHLGSAGCQPDLSLRRRL